jgi:hypothetical protein
MPLIKENAKEPPPSTKTLTLKHQHVKTEPIISIRNSKRQPHHKYYVCLLSQNLKKIKLSRFRERNTHTPIFQKNHKQGRETNTLRNPQAAARFKIEIKKFQQHAWGVQRLTAS